MVLLVVKMASSASLTTEEPKTKTKSKTPKTKSPSPPLEFDEFTPEWFDATRRAWRRNKLYLPSKQMFYYKDTTDNEYSPKEMRGKAKYPNADKWFQCCFIDIDGKRCVEAGNLYEAEISANPGYDYEKFTQLYFCDEHEHYQTKETRKRQAILDEYMALALSRVKSILVE